MWARGLPYAGDFSSDGSIGLRQFQRWGHWLEIVLPENFSNNRGDLMTAKDSKDEGWVARL